MVGFKARLSAFVAAVLLFTSAAPIITYAGNITGTDIEEASYLFGEDITLPDPEKVEVIEETDIPEKQYEEAENFSVLGSDPGLEDPAADLVLAGLKLIIEHAAGTAVDFGSNRILQAIFGGDKTSEEINKKLDEVLANQNRMIEEITAVERMITDVQLQTAINEFLKAYNEDTVYKNYYQTVTEIQKASMSDYQRKEEMISALTSGMSDAEKTSGIAKIDEYCQKIYALITTEYVYTLTDKQSHQGNLLQLYRDYMREHVLFEHKADESLRNFQDFVVGYFLNVAVIERLSLEARVQYCIDNNLDCKSVETRISELQSQLKGSDTEPYKKTGVAKLLEEQRPCEKPYRYFWVPGYELKFYTDVESRVMPREPLWSDAYRDYDIGYNFEKSDGFPNMKIQEGFWSPLWKNSVNEKAPALQNSDFQKLLDGAYNQTGSRMDLYTLLFDEKYGECRKTGSYAIDENTMYMIDRDDPDYKFGMEKTKDGMYGHDYSFYCYVTENRASANQKKWRIGIYEQNYNQIVFIPYEKYGKCYFERNNENHIFAVVAKYTESSNLEYESPEIKDFSEKPEKYVILFDTNGHGNVPAQVVTDGKKAVQPAAPAQSGWRFLGWYEDSGTTVRFDFSKEIHQEYTLYAKWEKAGSDDDDNEDTSYSDIPQGAVTGSWNKAADGTWTFADSNGRAEKNSWAYIYNPYSVGSQPKAGWFRFSEEGIMLTGWFDDTDGSRYYLNPASDGIQGIMLNGWQLIDGKWYYFSEAKGSGTFGALLRNAVTPDGYRVGADGVWIP